MNAANLTQSIKSEAKRLGFQLSGACPAVTPAGFSHFSQWLDAGYAGEMRYLEERKEAYQHPHSVMEGVESLLMLGMNYSTVQPKPTKSSQGRISRYAWGSGDYHDLIHKRLKSLCQFTRSLGDEISVRGVIDTAPLLEREFAALAGLGWQAKNTMLISRQQGSWFFLAAMLINQTLEYDVPIETNHCGKCTACLTACPTDAFTGPHVLDATRCISYLTIEHRTSIPVDIRNSIDDWVFGCDVCQEVCPWNRFASPSQEDLFHPLPANDPFELHPLFDLDDETFRARFRKTPLWRSKRRGILRNAAIVLGNHADSNSTVALSKGINDVEPLVRAASAWALGQINTVDAKQSLADRISIESDPDVIKELNDAIGRFP